MNITKMLSFLIATVAVMLSVGVSAEEHKINAEARIFKPDVIYVQVGDTVSFDNMTSHNAVSYITPEGGTQFGEKGKLPGGSFSVTLDHEGIYGFACEPHIGFGMVGAIAVGTITQEMKDAAMKNAMENLDGPFKRIIGKIKKVEVK